MKKIKKITGIALIVMALALPAFARGPGMGPGGMGPGFGPGPGRNCDNCPNNLTEEQQEKLKELHKTFQDKTAESRTEIMKRQIDLTAELNKDEPDLKKAKTIQKDINELQAKISDAHLEFIIEAKKINPDIAPKRGAKMEREMRGRHRGL